MSTNETGNFTGFALLSHPEWDKQQLIATLKTDWDIEFTSVTNLDDADEPIVEKYKDMTVIIQKFNARIPDEEAESCASNNYLWSEAVEVTNKHQAHILVTILGEEANLLDRAILFVKILTSLTKQQNTIGIYTAGSVFEPEQYATYTQMLQEGYLPLANLIWFGLAKIEDEIYCYTYGMKYFGKLEIEVKQSQVTPSEILEQLYTFANYIISQDVIIADGETFGLSEQEVHTISIGKGAVLQQEQTIKLSM